MSREAQLITLELVGNTTSRTKGVTYVNVKIHWSSHWRLSNGSYSSCKKELSQYILNNNTFCYSEKYQWRCKRSTERRRSRCLECKVSNIKGELELEWTEECLMLWRIE